MMDRAWFVLLLAAGCTQNISETRMKSFPPHAKDCELQVLSGMPYGGESAVWDLAGVVTVGDLGSPDPFSVENKKIVRPRACAMGGEALSIMASQNSTAVASGSSVSYMVWRKRSAQGASPQKF